MPRRSPGCPKHLRASTECGSTAEKMEAGCSGPLRPQSRRVRKRPAHHEGRGHRQLRQLGGGGRC
eukprot:6628631-Prymnesium_polylepis.1